MKKRKILYLFPLAALVLSGCTFQEGWESFTSWINDNIVSPISSLFGGKKNSDSKKKDSSGGSVTPSTDGSEDPIVAEEVGSVDNPITMTEFKTLCDTNIDFNSIAASSSTTDFTHIAYLKAKVTGNTWNDEGTKILYLNLCDPNNSSSQATARYAIVDQAITGDYSEKDSMKGLEVVVRGYPALYNHPKNGKTYQLGSKGQNDNDNPRVLQVEANDPIPGVDYGSLESPLTISAAKSVIDLHKPKPTAKKLFVTGKVLSNDAYDEGYGNVMRITISDSDGKSSLVVFKCATFPEGFDGTAITENSLKNKTIVVSGLGELFNGSTYELTSPKIHSIEGEDVPPVVIDDYGSLESPLTVAEARAVVDAQSPTSQTMYVTGVIKSNQAYSTEYKNTNIWITDPNNTDVEFELYGCSLPEGFTPAQPVKNDPALVGKVVVAHGTGKIYGSTYEFDKGCAIDSITEFVPVEVEDVTLSNDEISMEVDDLFTLQAFVYPNEANQEVEWTVEQEGDVISFDTETGIITGLSVGTATITATSVENADAHASCVVTVSEKTKILSDLEVDTSEVKKQYNTGEAYSTDGIKVIAKYSNADDQDVTAAATISIVGDVTTASPEDESFTIKVSYGEIEKDVVIAVEVSDKTALQVAYEAALDLGNNTPSSEPYTFSGVCTGITGNSYYLQDGEYGMYIYNKQTADLEIGKIVSVTATVKQYNGLPETASVSSAEVTGDGTPVTPAEIGSKADLEALKINVLANIPVATLTNKGGTWSGSNAPIFKFTVGSDEIEVKLDKYGFDEEKGALLNGANVGEQFVLGGVFTSMYNTPQIQFAGTSTVSKIEKSIVEIVSATGPSEEVPLNGEVKASDVTVMALFEGESEARQAVVTSVVEADTSTGGEHTGYVMVNGYSQQVPFTYVVSQEESQTIEVTILPNQGEAVDGGTTGKEWTINGENVKIVAVGGLSSDMMKIFKNKTMTVSSTTHTILKIEFTCYAKGDAKYGPGCFTVEGDYSVDEAVGTWTGSANSVTFTAATNQVRISTMTVTLQK